jgi:hypothetical protein
MLMVRCQKMLHCRADRRERNIAAPPAQILLHCRADRRMRRNYDNAASACKRPAFAVVRKNHRFFLNG